MPVSLWVPMPTIATPRTAMNATRVVARAADGFNATTLDLGKGMCSFLELHISFVCIFIYTNTAGN